MAMITMKGQIVNVFKANDSRDRETGEIRQGKHKIQIMGKLPLESGDFQLAMHDMSIPELETFKPFQGKWVEVALGIMSSGDNTIFYIPRGSKPVEIDAKSA